MKKTSGKLVALTATLCAMTTSATAVAQGIAIISEDVVSDAFASAEADDQGAYDYDSFFVQDYRGTNANGEVGLISEQVHAAAGGASATVNIRTNGDTFWTTDSSWNGECPCTIPAIPTDDYDLVTWGSSTFDMAADGGGSGYAATEAGVENTRQLKIQITHAAPQPGHALVLKCQYELIQRHFAFAQICGPGINADLGNYGILVVSRDSAVGPHEYPTGVGDQSDEFSHYTGKFSRVVDHGQELEYSLWTFTELPSILTSYDIPTDELGRAKACLHFRVEEVPLDQISLTRYRDAEVHYDEGILDPGLQLDESDGYDWMVDPWVCCDGCDCSGDPFNCGGGGGGDGGYGDGGYGDGGYGDGGDGGYGDGGDGGDGGYGGY